MNNIPNQDAQYPDAASWSDHPRFWPVVHAWAVGRLTNREFVREQLRTVGFIWIQPEAAS